MNEVIYIKEYLIILKNTRYNNCFRNFLIYHGICFEYLDSTQVYIIKTNCCYVRYIKSIPYVLSVAYNHVLNENLGPKPIPLPTISDLIEDEGDALDWGVYRIKAENLWRKGFTGQGINVAVLDTGIAKHIALDIKGEVSFIDGESPNDVVGHGTEVAGIIATKKNSGVITGVAYGCNLFNVKVNSGTYENFIGDLESLVKGLEWCIDNNMNVINLSGGFEDIQCEELITLIEVVQRVIDKGIIIVCATGNTNSDELAVPAQFNNVISVGATNKQNERWQLTNDTGSNYGLNLDFMAPGVVIASTGLNNGYELCTGTSFAAPHVTGLIALLLSEDPTRTYNDILNILKTYSLPLPPNSGVYNSEYGYGLVQAPDNL